MARRVINRRELREEYEAAEAQGKLTPPVERSRSSDGIAVRGGSAKKPASSVRMKVVWAVCDVGGRTVATFDYSEKSEAEAKAAALKKQGKGMHFVRSLKEPMG